MRYAVVIVGVSGNERYLADQHETTELRRADRFASERAAEVAAKARIAREAPVVRKHMGFRVEPVRSLREARA
jgi:hypothetical protein